MQGNLGIATAQDQWFSKERLYKVCNIFFKKTCTIKFVVSLVLTAGSKAPRNCIDEIFTIYGRGLMNIFFYKKS
jgi:hypothetical protein